MTGKDGFRNPEHFNRPRDARIFRYSIPNYSAMTFQIGLRGSDGILLASDTRITFRHICEWHEECQRGLRWLSRESKIQISEKHNLALAMAGPNFSSLVAARILETLDATTELPKDFAGWISGITEGVYKEHFEDSHFTDQDRPTVTIIAPDQAQDKMLRVEVDSKSIVSKLRGKIIAGDAANPAIFFVERYYDDKKLRPVSELLFMAAHAILMGSKLNTWVDGLEFAICKPHSRPELITDIDSLVEASTALDETLAKEIFSYRPN